MAKYDSAGALLAEYAQGTGIDEPLSMSQGGTTAYYSADGLGSVTSLEDGTGSVLAAYRYDSFGNLISPEPVLMNSFRYTGREWDQETGLYYYRARYYDPSLGRFLSEDPIGFGGGINFYAYVENSPISNIDPSGLARCMYVINGGQNGGGWFDCTPDNPKNKPVSFAAASGNNGDSQHHCKNNADCAPISGHGPIPPGWWRFGGVSQSHARLGGRHLTPIPGSLTNTYGRDGMLTHWCLNPFSNNPPQSGHHYCSEGCITASEADIKALNNLLDAEPGSILYVTSIKKD